MSKYKVSVNISKSISPYLIKNGFYLCLAQNMFPGARSINPPNGSTLQWLTSIIDSNVIDVSWTNNYQIFYTTSDITTFQHIIPLSIYEAQIGKKYSYQSDWQYVGSSSGGTEFLQLTNNNNYNLPLNLGVSQSGSIGGQTQIQVPIAVQSVPAQGNAQFEFLNTCNVLVYFSNENRQPGTLIPSLTCTDCNATTQFISVFVHPDIPINLSYTEEGKWQLQPK